MGFVIILPLGVLAGWAIVRIFLWLRRGKFGREWWRAFGLLATAGAVLGAVFVFFVQYGVAGIKHIEGFPIPLVILSREKPGAPWVHSAIPAPVQLGAGVADFLSGVAICLVPLAVAAFFKENRGKREFTGPPSGRAPSR